MKIQLLLLIFILPLTVLSQASKEDQYLVKYKSGAFVPEKTLIKGKGHSSSAMRTEGYPGSYRLVQFLSIPSEEQQQKIKSVGIELLEYVPNNAYWAYFSTDPSTVNTENLNIRSILEILPSQKIDPQLTRQNLPEWIIKDGGKLGVIVKYFKKQSFGNVRQSLKELGAEVVREMIQYNQFEILISKDKIKDIARIAEVAYIYPVAPAPKTLGSGGIHAHNINVLNSNAINGRNLNGEGVVIGIGDGGYLDFHHDYQLRIKNADKIYSSSGAHSIHVAGIIAGGGNMNPGFIGGASKARLINYSFYNVVLNAPSLFKSDNMVITNNSYGFEQYYGYYDYYSVLVDKQVKENPSLLHVFAAGNEYGINTVSGAFNSAKNVLTVGSVESENILADYSSKGPVADGRIKPEIVAVGSDVTSLNQEFGYSIMSGTSMATPAVSSVAALLYQRHEQLYKSTAKSDLIKAILCNSADDLGNFGPDYFYGFGKVNARRAVETLESKRYLVDSVKQYSNKNYTITVPQGTSKIKVMLYWHDQEASDVASVALVNDLDLELISGGTKYFPLILNPNEPEANAIPGKDHTNNIEQVSIDQPKSGTYTLRVRGSNVPFAKAQKFIVTYEIIKPEIILTYPFGEESFAPGDAVEVKWDNYTGHNLNIDYSPDNGKTWKTLASDFPSNDNTFTWQVPDVLGKGIIRLKAGNFTSQSQPFNIIGTPDNLSLSVGSPGTVSLTWAKVKGATSYDVFLLAPDLSECKLIETTTVNSYSFKNLNQSASYLFSVRAKTSTLTGKRTVAARKQLNDPLVKLVNPVSGQKYNGCDQIKVEAEVTATSSNSKMEILLDGVPIYQDWEAPYETLISYSPGSYQLEVNIINEFGAKASVSQNLDIVTPSPAKLPYSMNFESDPGNWTALSPIDKNIWSWGTPSGKVIKNASSGKKAWYTKIPKEVELVKEYSVVTPAFNLREVHGPVVISFKQNLALASPSEGVFLEYSTNCGNTWMNLGNRSSNGLNWYDSKLKHWNGEYFSNKDAWTNSKTGWRDIKLVIPEGDLAESDVQFKITYYLAGEATVWSEGIALDDFKIERFVNKPVIKKDSLALVAFYNSLNGKNWDLNLNWLDGPVKDWYGVETFDGRVSNLNLWNNNLLGKIPSSIGDLEELKSLTLSYNMISGNIPSTIGNLKNLALLDLDKNQLSGSIPSQIGNCKNIYLLFLSSNQLQGDIPDEIGNLEKLEWAFLDFNKLTGEVPVSIKNCGNLEWFNLNYNRLTSIPDLNGAKCRFELNVQKNKLTFRDLEPNMVFFPYSYFYEEQDSVGSRQYHELDPGTSFVLNANFAGNSTNNRYQWFKDGKSISGKLSSPLYELKNVPAGFSAVYYCAITNSKVPDLTLYTQPIKVKVKNPKAVYRLDVGGVSVIKAYPLNWLPDSKIDPSPHLQVSATGQVHSDNLWENKANNTGVPTSLFTSYRTESASDGIEYQIPLKNGNYLVNLFFAEKPKALGVHTIGEHTQDVFIENERVLQGFDMYRQNKYNAIRRYFNVWVYDGKLSIKLKGVKGPAHLNGIEVSLISELPSNMITKNSPYADRLNSLLLNVFPNPVKNNFFSVAAGSFSGKMINLKVYDRFFKVQFEQDIKAGTDGLIPVTVNARNFSPGVYFVKITEIEGGGTKLARFMKE